jgi:hypothetical protein
MLSYSTGPLLGNLRSGLTARFVGIGGSVVWGGVLCVAGTVALALTLPKFVHYDGRGGLARKQEEDAAWASRAAAREGGAIPLGTGLDALHPAEPPDDRSTSAFTPDPV